VTKELRLTLRVRNNRLIAAREALGLSAREAAARMGVSYQRLLEYEGLRLSPLGAHNSWKKAALRICAFYGATVEHFWSEAVMAVVEPVRTVEVDGMDVARLTAPVDLAALPSDVDVEDEFLRAEQSQKVREGVEMLDKLDPRVAQVIRLRFGLDGEEPKTLNEVGAVIDRLVMGTQTGMIEGVGVSGSRAQLLQEEGLAMLRRSWTGDRMSTPSMEREALEARKQRERREARNIIERREEEEARRFFCPACSASPWGMCRGNLPTSHSVHPERRKLAAWKPPT